MRKLPSSPDLVAPLLTLLASGSILSNQQIRDELATKLSLDPEQLSRIRSGSRTEFEYRLAWARTYAKTKGLIQSPTRMHWQITELGKTEGLDQS